MKEFTYCLVELPQCNIVNGLYGNVFVVSTENKKLPLLNNFVGDNISIEKPNKVKLLFGKATKKVKKPNEEILELCNLYLANSLDDAKLKTFDYPIISAFNKLTLKLKNIDNIRTSRAVLYSDSLKISAIVDYVADYNGKISVILLDVNNTIAISDYYLIATAYAIMWEEHVKEAIEQIVIIKYMKNSVVPLIYVDTIDKYIVPLLKRIKKYYEE